MGHKIQGEGDNGAIRSTEKITIDLLKGRIFRKCSQYMKRLFVYVFIYFYVCLIDSPNSFDVFERAIWACAVTFTINDVFLTSISW